MFSKDLFDQPTSRRRFLGYGATGLGAVIATTLVGCGSSDSPESTPTAAAAGKTPATTATTTATATTGGTASAKTLVASQAFIAMLDDTQKATAVVADRSAANLGLWSNLPDQLFKRSGLRMDKLAADQVKGVQAILAAALSQEGLTQVNQITTADGVLAASGGQNLDFGADHYWIRFVGTPSDSAAWTIQYGGHHLAVNVTVVGSNMTMAPTLWGAQPAMYAVTGVGVEPLSGETNKAFEMMNALDATQQTAAILTGNISEIVLGAGQDGKTLVQEGVKASTFNAEQKTKLLALVQEWLRPLNDDNSAAKLKAAEGEIDQMTFAWHGSTQLGQPIYYRVQSPTFVIEFAHQQGGGANAGGITHIHSIYREIGNDYGARL